MNNVKQWLNDLYSQGYLCRGYESRIDIANSKEDLFKIVCDANGISFIPELINKGVDVPIKMLKKEFKNFINGQYKPKYDGKNVSYSSCLYLDCNLKSIIIDTTLASLIQYDGEVIIPKNIHSTICIGGNSDITFVLNERSFLRLNVYGSNKINIVGDQSRVRINKM